MAAKLRDRYAPRGRWLGPHRYHLTLQFLGEFDRLPPTLSDEVRAAAYTLRLAASDLPLDRAGSFRGSRVWWLGCDQVPCGLQQLWGDLARALAKAGVRVKGSPGLTPHVTLLRDAAEPLPAMAIEPITWPVREFVLIHSQLGSRNAYDVLQRWPLDQ
jgi:2'-5' RNA ligase